MTNKLKITIIALSVLIFLGILGIFLVLISNKNNSAQTAQTYSSYTFSATEFDKIVTEKVTANGQNIPINSDNLNQYGIVTFNTPHDIMWVLCPNGYKQSNPTSSTNNRPDLVQDVGSTIDITEGVQNNLTVTCSK
jgi:hypothetical protein